VMGSTQCQVEGPEFHDHSLLHYSLEW
jgi:hypothetical protein